MTGELKGRARTTDGARRPMFRAEDVPALLTELREIEKRLDTFARRCQEANLRRPGANGFYSGELSTIGAPDGWLRRVRQTIQGLVS